jgi:hypothetical protein
MKVKCPKCGSEKIKIEGDDLFSYLVCEECGFDESLEFEADLGDRKSKGGGGSPYKRGGALRVQKRSK